MKYCVPFYKIVNNKESQIGRVTVDVNSLGAFEVNSGMKIHISTGYVNFKEEWKDYDLISPYIKKSDLCGKNLSKSVRDYSEVNGKTIILVKGKK